MTATTGRGSSFGLLKIALITSAIGGATTHSAQAWWTYLENQGAPIANVYLGDSITNIIKFAVNQGTVGWTIHFGMGTTVNGSGWEWAAAAWDRTESPNNFWKNTAGSLRFKATGNNYYSGRFYNGSRTEYASAGWQADRTSLSASSYFTVNALNTPTAPGATPANASQINLAWTKGVSGNAKNTMIVRSTSSAFTAPTQGSAYSTGNPLGAGTVIYNGSATSVSDTGLSANTTYYYAFYAENYSYYSAAATASATTPLTAPVTQATAVTLGGERSSQLAVSWTSGSGTRRVVIARASAAPTGTPTDGSDYSSTFNSNLSAAPSLGDGKVVYDGTSSSFTLTGLSPNTTYYVRVFEYNGTGASTKYNTSSASGNPNSGQTLGAPTSVSAAPNPGNNPATRIDLGWTKNNGKNVLIVRSTSSNFTAPTEGSAYATGSTIGSGTVVYNGSATATTISGLMPGTTYYLAFYSENYSYYSSAATANTSTWIPEARNTDGGSPGIPAGTLYLGDNGTFTAQAWGVIEANYSRARMWLSSDATLGGADPVTAYTGYQNTTPRSLTSPRFFQTGTLYWGLQLEYGSPYGDGFWYKNDLTSWTAMSLDGNGATLTIAIAALNTPTAPSATPANASQINLAWTKGVSGNAKNTMIVRSTSSTFTAPTQGSAYSTGNALGAGTVIYNGSATSTSDNGLSANTTYYYAFYAENYSYYSAAVTANATTDALAPPAAPVATAATSPDWWTSFQANWNASAGATGYRLDVSSDPTFSGEWVVQNQDVGNVTNSLIQNLVVGQYFYRVRAYNGGGESPNSNVISAELGTAAGRNKSAGTPYYTPATLYVGDDATFGVDTWGTIQGNYGQARAIIDTDSNLSVGGIRGNFAGWDNVEYTEAVSPRFTSAGTWYWGIQMNYGSPYGTNFWLVRDTASWAYLQYKGTNANLTVTVLPLGDPNPVSAVQDGGNPTSQINLNWTRWNSKAVMVVRSTTSNFTAPTPGSSYSSGNTIGSGLVLYRGSTATAISDTGLNANQTYYYRFYTENWSYYSDGADANASTAAGCVNGTAPTMPHPGNPVVYANNSAQVNFNLLASDTSGCPAPTFTHSQLPTGASFTPSPAGNLNTGTFSWTPQLAQVGTYPILFTATDSENLTTSVVVKVIVGIGSPQEGNTSGIPNSQYNWAVGITAVEVDTLGNASVTYQSTNGMAYDVYQSDSIFGGGMTWSRVETRKVANGNTDFSDQHYAGTRRYFAVVPTGAQPTTNGVWGVIRPTVNFGWNLLSSPLLSDRSFSGAFGENLALGLTGAGTQNGSDQVHALDASGNPYVLWINSNDNNTWYEGGAPATRQLSPGQGFMIYRQGASTMLPLSGAVGNFGTDSFTIKNGMWNMIGFSQGKNLSGNPLPGSLSGTPVASFQFSQADILTVLNANGTWKNYQRFGNNMWLDLQTMTQSSTISMQPGQGFYYYRQPGPNLTVGF